MHNTERVGEKERENKKDWLIDHASIDHIDDRSISLSIDSLHKFVCIVGASKELSRFVLYLPTSNNAIGRVPIYLGTESLTHSLSYPQDKFVSSIVRYLLAFSLDRLSLGGLLNINYYSIYGLPNRTYNPSHNVIEFVGICSLNGNYNWIGCPVFLPRLKNKFTDVVYKYRDGHKSMDG